MEDQLQKFNKPSGGSAGVLIQLFETFDSI